MIVQVTFDPAHLVLLGGRGAIMCPAYWTVSCETGQYSTADTLDDACTMLALTLGVDPIEITAARTVTAASLAATSEG